MLRGVAAALSLALLAGPRAEAGAWPAEEGEGQAITSFTFDSAARALDDDGDASIDADFQKIETSSFIEWGMTERLTLVAQPVFQTVEQRDADGGLDTGTGFASSKIGARFLLGRPAGGALSAQGVVVSPGEAENVTDAPLGDGGVAVESRLLAGRGWGGERRGVFVEGQVGYRWRTDDDPNETRLDATLGVRATADWMLIGQSFSTWSDGDSLATQRAFRSHKAQFSVVRRVNDAWSVQLGGFGTYAGRNVVDERAAFASVWRRFGGGRSTAHEQ